MNREIVHSKSFSFQLSEQTAVGSFPDGFDSNYETENAEVVKSTQLMSQISIEAPTVEPTTSFAQQQQEPLQQNSSSNALSELLGLELHAPPEQDMFSTGMFQQQFPEQHKTGMLQQPFHENFGNSTYGAPTSNVPGFFNFLIYVNISDSFFVEE
jgi:hypothetical protein